MDVERPLGGQTAVDEEADFGEEDAGRNGRRQADIGAEQPPFEKPHPTLALLIEIDGGHVARQPGAEGGAFRRIGDVEHAQGKMCESESGLLQEALVDDRVQPSRRRKGVEAGGIRDPDAVDIDPDAGDAGLATDEDRLLRAGQRDHDIELLVLPLPPADGAEEQEVGAGEIVTELDDAGRHVGNQLPPVRRPPGDEHEGGDDEKPPHFAITAIE